MVDTIKTDVLIVGAGPVGAHAARLFAQNGLDVVLLEKNEKNRCGAQWVNGVPFWQLSDAGLQMPASEEIYHEGGIFSIISPLGHSRVTLHDAPLLDIDMRLFGLRLLEDAESQKGVRTYYKSAFKKLNFDDDGRPISATTSIGDVYFSLVVDASGLSAAVRKQVPLLAKMCPQPTLEDLCTAAQEVREIQDIHGAQSFLESNHGVPGEALAWVNVAGGFSLLRVHVAPDLRRVAFLTGARPLPEIPSAKDLIRQFVKENSWVGSLVFGGQRPVPLRRPYAALCAPGVALLGDAGCQVYSAHASGIGISLVAAQILSETLAAASKAGEDIGDGEVIARYAFEFHKKHGALLANSDATRRFSQDLTKAETHVLIERQMMTTKMISDSLFQKPVGLHIPDLPKQLLQSARHPLLARRVFKVAAKVPLINALTKLYPRQSAQDPERLQRFENAMERLVSY